MTDTAQDFILSGLKRLNGGTRDILIRNGRIAEIAPGGSLSGESRIDCSDYYVSSGWIDLHVHAFPEFDPYGDDIDEIGIKSGVTTIVDAGSCGADRIADLVALGEQATTHLLAFLNISRIGLKRIDELSHLGWIDEQKLTRAIDTFKTSIVGLKVRMSQSVVGKSGIRPLSLARALSETTELPLMVHIGSAPPSVDEILPYLKQGDVITHYLNGKSNGLFCENGEPRQVLRAALHRGVHLDVGHGSASFSFKVAEAAKAHHIGLHTISTDIYRHNRLNGPVYNMANVLSKFLYLGYTLADVIAAVTTHAADWLRKPELGRIQVGAPANLTLFTVKDEPITLIDSEGEERIGTKRIEAQGVVINGTFIKC
ncbi:dihydroorotase [Pullulanibacillus camelliae]|uniref:Dihydroorotase n=1 Tax=Pullulanibacillus camelliae TaxID=1707096 RepID=A0A8J2YEN6_9BACL|nr:amidohydrolase/deacetylase family metallohydrolase [Pullulanibacillus camelliae]GGE26910.1 dihydroorotase [Pullulanibacillus camelliae]